MASSILIDIITPEQTVFRGEALSVSIPTPGGEITVLPNHIPLITIVVPGSVLLRTKDDEQVFAVSRGVVEVTGTTVRILADIADRAEDLEEKAIEQAKEKAEKLLSERRTDEEGFAEATAILERELARLTAVRRLRSRGSKRRMP